MYPNAEVITAGVRAKLTGKVVPSFLAIEKKYDTFDEAMLVDRPNELMNLSATVSVACNGVYPKAVVIVKGVRLKETGKVVPSFLAIEKKYDTFDEAMLVDRPNELMNLSAAVSVA